MSQLQRLGKYRILKPLGAGAMGEVYLAEHEMLRVLHAVKILPPEACGKPGFEKRFREEARIMARLRHPGIVSVHDLGRDEVTGAYYIAMDFVSPDGRTPQTLDDLLEQSGGRLPHERVGEMLHALCEAVAYAHARGVLHRDIKPSNILIDAGGSVRLADFGLAEIVGQEYINQSIMASRFKGSVGMTGSIPAGDAELDTLGAEKSGMVSRADSLVGSFHFMPPEVQEGGEWSERGDVYSLGVVAYRSLVGRYPIGAWEPPSELFEDILSVWDDVVKKALKSRPLMRFGSVKEMGASIPSVSQETVVTKHRRYDKPFFFRDKAYHTVESLVEAFAETGESWNDSLLAIGKGYVRKWLESNDDYGRAMELEKHAEKSPEEQRVALLLAYASSENPEVLFRLGECYRIGWGAEKDDEAAAKRLSEAAGFGHQGALEFIRKEAESGDAPFAFYLGQMYLGGTGVEKDEKHAAKWYAVAAESGESRALKALESLVESDVLEAAHLLSVMLSEGRGTERDVERAALLCRKAAECGYEEAVSEMERRSEAGDAVFAFHLGVYLSGTGVKNSKKSASIYLEKSAKRGEPRALPALKKLAERDFAEATHALARMYSESLGVSRDDGMAFGWIRKSAELGNAEAQCHLGSLFERGRGVSRNERKAAKWYRKAAEQGNAEAQFHLGSMFERGRGVPRDEKQAAKWYRKAAEQGDGTAQYNLGLMYEKGRGVPQRGEEAAVWYERAAEQGNASAQLNLAIMYETGRDVHRNEELAAVWYERAAEQGNAHAQCNLGSLYRKGLGVAQDNMKAVELYLMAAEQGNADAQNNLGVMYAQGLGARKDDLKAVEWYEKAAEQGHASAQFNLGTMYANGRGVPKDNDTAKGWYEKAAERGHLKAQLKILSPT